MTYRPCDAALTLCFALYAFAAATEPTRAAHAVEFKTSCNVAVRDDFNAAVTLLHHMTYPQARAAFAAIGRRDPACAMTHWGIAMTLFQPLWPTRPGPSDLRLGWKTLQDGLALRATPRERAYLQATATFFENPEAADYWPRVERWERAMAELHQAYPQDDEATAFYALALLATARPGPSLSEHSAKAVALLLPVYRRHPDHPGAMHYVIHADDIPGREHENADIVRRYERIAPDNPHALHMPTHIYTRLGDWDGVVRGNLRAADAALKFPAGDNGEWVWDEFAHAIEYLVYAYLQLGADVEAKTQIARLMTTANLEPSAKTAFHLASTRARYALERRAWNEAAALTPRDPPTIEWDRFPWPEAVVVFARGYGAARSDCDDDMRTQLARLGALKTRAEAIGETIFALQIRVLELELSAAVAHCANDDAGAVALLRQAVELEGSTPKPPVTPAATLPAAELLGDLLLDLDRPRDALVAYERALSAFPHRLNGQIGVARSAAAIGDAAAAARAYCTLPSAAVDGGRAAAVADVRSFLGGAEKAAATCRVEAPKSSSPGAVR